MTKFVGRRGILGAAKESSRGTAIGTPTFWLPRVTISFDDHITSARETEGLGKIADSDSNYVTQKQGSGAVDFEVDDRIIGIFLTSLLGSSPVQAGGPTYTYTYTLANTNQHQSLSILYQDPDTTKVFPLGVVNSLKFTAAQNAIVSASADFMSRYGRDWATATPVFTALGSKFLHQHVQMKLASSIAGLSGATVLQLKSLDLTISANTEFDTVLGTVEPKDILNQQFSVEGTIELLKNDETYRNLMMNGTYNSMDLTFNGSSSSKLQFQFPRVDFTEWEQDRTLDTIVSQKINFKGNYDAANALDIISTCVLTNNYNTANY